MKSSMKKLLVCLLMVCTFAVLAVGCSTEEVAFTTELDAPARCYLDVSIINPYITVVSNENGEEVFTDIVCDCITADDEYVFIFMTAEEYIENFDTSLTLEELEELDHTEPVEFDVPIRIHGMAKNADDLCEDLSYETGETIFLFKSMN